MTEFESTHHTGQQEDASSPAPEVAEPRFVRDTRFRIAGGVAAGLAGATGIHVALIRIAFVVATMLNGVGVLAYLAALIAMPTLEDVRHGRDRHWRGPRQVYAGILGALAAFLLVAPFSPNPTIWLPVLLIGIGIALWQPTPRIRFPFRAAAAAEGSTALPTPAPSQPPPPRWRDHAERPSYLGRLCTAAAVLALGVALALSRLGRFDLTAGRAAALLLVVIGMGLVVGAFAGRARWGILPAAVLIPLTVVLCTLDRVGLDPLRTVGSQTHHVRSVHELPTGYRTGTGGVYLDLSGLTLDGTSRKVTVEAAIGDIQVLVPAGVTVDVDARTALGQVSLLAMPTGWGVNRYVVGCVPAQRSAWAMQSYSTTDDAVVLGPPAGTCDGGQADPGGKGHLHLVLRDGLGSIHIHQVPEAR